MLADADRDPHGHEAEMAFDEETPFEATPLVPTPTSVEPADAPSVPAVDAPPVHAVDAPPEVPATVAALEEQVAALTAELSAAQRRADDTAVVARRQSEMADELHAENRRLRDGEIREAVAPLVRGLARLFDDLSRMRDAAGDQSPDIAFVAARVEDLLHDAGVTPVRPAPGEHFDPQIHQATGSTPTGDATCDRRVAELRRAGLRRDDGRMLRPADVVVFRHDASAAVTTVTDTPTMEREA